MYMAQVTDKLYLINVYRVHFTMGRIKLSTELVMSYLSSSINRARTVYPFRDT
jgi:hypothetical protein